MGNSDSRAAAARGTIAGGAERPPSLPTHFRRYIVLINCKEPWSEVITKGTVLWRPVSFSSISNEAESSCRFIHTDSIFKTAPNGNGYVARVSIPGTFIPEPEIIPAKTRAGRPRPGLVVFVNEKPIGDWTHLIVTGHTEKLHTQGCTVMGGALYAIAGKAFDLSDYSRFRTKMLKVWMQTIDSSFKEAAGIIDQEVWPDEARNGLIRLVINKHNDKEQPYEAYQIVDDSKDFVEDNG